MLSAKQIYIWGCLVQFAKIIWGYTDDPKSFQRRGKKDIHKGAKNLGGTRPQKQHWQLEVHESALSKFQGKFVFNLEV